MVRCLVGLGSNLGESREILDRAVGELDQRLNVLACSQWNVYSSVGPADQNAATQPDFLNGVALVESLLPPLETAQVLHDIEQAAGRERIVRWSSRTLDADLLLYGDEIVDLESLQVPHPRMMCRRFVLEPACEIAAEVVHPVIGWTMRRLLDHLCHAQPYFAVLGSELERVQQLVRRLVDETEGILHSVERAAFPSSVDEGTIQSAEERLKQLQGEMASGRAGPWFTDFWVGEFASLSNAERWDPIWNPKLVMVTDPRQSKFARDLASWIDHAHARLCVPLLYLSSHESDAWQDALGAVQGMQ